MFSSLFFAAFPTMGMCIFYIYTHTYIRKIMCMLLSAKKKIENERRKALLLGLQCMRYICVRI